MGFEKGTEIFNVRGEVREVALDNRDKSGILWAAASWGKGREKVRGQGWFEKGAEANADLWAFIQLNKASLEPLTAERQAIERRIGRLREFAKLVANVVATGKATQYDLADCLKDRDSYRADDLFELTEKLGTPLKNEDAYLGFDYYEAAVTGLPNVPVVTVTGTNDKSLFLKGPADFRSDGKPRAGRVIEAAKEGYKS